MFGDDIQWDLRAPDLWTIVFFCLSLPTPRT